MSISLRIWPFVPHAALMAILVLLPLVSLAQSPFKSCTEDAQAPWCKAARGDRPGGWLPQGRSEVMSRNGIVAT
ncbi:MAG: hypothetical protein ABSE25_05980, partial [Syntrophorhabdales bacterium]